MKKSKVVLAALILSVAVFIGLLVYYFYTVQQDKPEVVSKREQYQNELLQKESE